MFLAQVTLVVSAAMAARPMLSYRAIDLGANAAQVGLLATTYAVLPVVFAFAIGRRIDRHGPARFMIAGSLVSIGGLTAAVLVPHLAVLYVATTAFGFGQLLSILAQQGIAAAVSTGDQDKSFGRFTSAAAVGLMVGPPIAAVTATQADALGLSEAIAGLLAGLVLAVGALIVTWTMTRRQRAAAATATAAPTEPTHRLAAQIVRTRGMWQALLAGATVLAAVDLLSAFLPLWATDRGISVGVVGLLLTIRGAFTLISRIGSEKLLRAVGRRWLLTGSLLIAAGGLVVLTFVDVVGAIVVMVVLGVGLGLAQPLTMSWIAAVAAPGTRAAALGMRLTANRIGQATLPATLAAVAAGTGANGVFWGAALILSGASAALVRAPMERLDRP